MSGHSKWATTKHKKAVDRRQARQAVRQADQEHRGRGPAWAAATPPATRRSTTPSRRPRSPRSPTTTSTARSSAAPAPRPGGADYQTIMYEGYGPSGVAMLIECLTDNRNRAAMEVRTAMTRNGGSLADPGSVSYLFNRKGVVIVPGPRRAEQVTEDDVARGHPRGRRRGGQRPRRVLRGRLARPPTWSRCAPRCRRPASTTTPPRRPFVPDHAGRARRATAPARCSGSSRRSRTPTTCRTSSPTSTSPTTVAELESSRPARRLDAPRVAAARRAAAGTGVAVSVSSEQVFGRTAQESSVRVLGDRPRPDPVRSRRRRRRPSAGR